MRFDWDAIDEELRDTLGRLGLSVDRRRVERFAADLAAGRLGPDSNRLREMPDPAGPDDVTELDSLSPEDRDRYTESGRAALDRGEVAAAVLNGGMATRFGGVVKGTVKAIGGRSFLEIKLAQARSHGRVPLLVMNSFATHEATQRFLSERGLDGDVHTFLQGVSLRLTPEGDLFRTGEGRLSPYAPGHGDFPESLRDSGLLAELQERGVRFVMLSNVDNLGAEVDPLIVGYHLEHGLPLTLETARAKPGDVGGAPVRVGGRLQVVEGFRFPKRFDFSKLRYFNSNTFLFSLSALERSYPLQWFYVEKKVEERTAIQMERLVGEVSSYVETAYLATPRDGARSRFLPAKKPEDLEALRQDPELVERFGRYAVEPQGGGSP